MIEKEPHGQRLEPGAKIRFACRPDLACFNTCCAQKRLPVLPYDLLRLRLALGLPSQEVLARFLLLEEDPASGWPVLRLSLTDEGRCPFVSDQGCAVYAHRPTACRLYPLSRAVSPARKNQPAREVYLRLNTHSCLGWEQERELTLAQWVLDQELAPYIQANDRLLSLFLHPARNGKLSLGERQTHGVVMALYNLDVLRQMLQRPEFAKGLNRDMVETAGQDDLALLNLGQDWIAKQLFPEG